MPHRAAFGHRELPALDQMPQPDAKPKAPTLSPQKPQVAPSAPSGTQTPAKPKPAPTGKHGGEKGLIAAIILGIAGMLYAFWEKVASFIPRPSEADMKRYRKAMAAVIGVTALAALRHYEIEVLGLDTIVLELVVSALTAWGVYQVPNAPASADHEFHGENV